MGVPRPPRGVCSAPRLWFSSGTLNPHRGHPPRRKSVTPRAIRPFLHRTFSAGAAVTLSCLLASVVLCSSQEQTSSSIYASYTTYNESINFTHVVVDPQTGHVYVGASNWLYQFSSSLELQASVRTGPVLDSVQCTPADCTAEDMTLTNNINKLLVMDTKSRLLIACGSAHQGSCIRHRIDNISLTEEKLVPVPIAANDENSSTFAFVGPAQYSKGQSLVLYVGTTNTGLGTYRDIVPAISTRTLDKPNLFSVIQKSFSSIARVDISAHLRDYYLVTYVYGFSSGGYAYFATVQRKSHMRALEEWGYITRLARFCTSDPAYNTYTEVTLQCLGPDGTDYNLLQSASILKAGNDLAVDLRIDPGSDVMVGVFTSSRDHTSRPSWQSAVCVFSLLEIEQKFSENIHLCYNGSVFSRNMDYIAGSVESCPEAGTGGNIFDFCGETLKLNGSVPIVAYAAALFSNTTTTSVTVTTTAQHSVAFVGTENGTLIKLLLTSSALAEEFEQVTVDAGYPILPDMHIDPSEQYVYVTTPYKISKVRVERCEQYASCEQCLQARNPYCGWCSLEKRCTVKGACHNATGSSEDQSSPRWLSLDTQQCIDFQSIQPEHLPITEMAVVELVINQLPQLPSGAHYLCVFGDSAPVQAEVTLNGLACVTPFISRRPKIPDNQDHVVVDLAVRSSETKTDFLHRPFAFYDCSKHRKCSACVTSSWICNWCLHDNLCTHNETSCTQNVNTTDESSHQLLIRGRHHCPSFSIRDEILLPHGVAKEIVLGVKNLPNPAGNLQCVVEIEGAKEVVAARAEDNVIICAETAYTYQKEVGDQKAILTVVWKGDTFIDKTEVTLFKCHLLGSHAGRGDCSLCLTRDSKYQCAWCGGTCNFEAFCDVPKSLSCPPPRIDWIHPLSGPKEGGTLVTIVGSNLGTSEKEIQGKITIGGIPCSIIDYSISVRVVCQTGSSDSAAPAEVMAANNAGFTKAREKFHYKFVELVSVHPNSGPQSGGTRLYLTGSNLNVGSILEVSLDDLPCVVDRTLASNSQISCRTSPAPYSSFNVSYLYLRIDNATLVLAKPFTYTDDPTILRISPLKSFLSGGRTMTIVGTNLSSVQQPRMAVFFNDTILNESICNVQSSTHMICPSPSVGSKIQALQPDGTPGEGPNKWRFRIGFVMDEVQTVKELQDFFPSLHSDLIYVPDPKFFPFDDKKIKLYKGESLVIEGENLRLASTELEVNVTIGTRPCNLTSLAMTQLVCLPPEVQPQGTDEIGRRTENGLPLVSVRVGHNLRFEIGYLRYEVVKTFEFPPAAVAGIAVAGSLLILVTMVILAFMRQKNSHAEREYKRIQLQMDTLENSVRSECKQAFAELQTDMTDLTNDLETTGIPTLDHRSYVMKVFFPGVYDHPLLQDTKIRTNGMYSNYEVAMNHFEQLLNNKSFLLAFIDVCENQKSFSIRDRVNVASLLMVIFTERMEYATDVLRTLLFQLVEKSVCSKHPQLMLRRTESVVEKMLTNWMALCMYDYLKENAGSSLFLLFSAIKHQVEKGPVDAITHDARYSLSEERLLREQIEFSNVTVQVIQDDLDEKVFCKMNDCDTITQVKAKILDALYKNTPFSLRPSVHDVDLVLSVPPEWRHGRGGHLTLSDEDLTTKTQQGWRRINTLKHYGVRESAIMGLVTKQNDSFSSNCSLLPCPPGTGNTSLNSASPIVSAYDVEQGVRYWHLVKSVEDHYPSKEANMNHKTITEIFLTRLLSTKGTVQKFVDDFLSTILAANEVLPPAIKWLFDLLDEAAVKHNLPDPEVVHAWKSNSLPLRFWVNFIKNPDFILDIQKSPIVDSCLSVVAQTLMDACSMSEHRLGKDSPSNKLLFARDIPTYRKTVLQFYQDIAALPAVTDQEMSATMQALSLAHSGEFDTISALKELYVYASKYNDSLLESLEQDAYCQKLHLAHKLETVACTLDGEETSVC